MKITLVNGTELESLGVHGQSTMYQGANRDSLIFLFSPDAASIETILQEFTAENCTAIKIQDGDGVSIHEGYTIRTQAGVGLRETALGREATDSSEMVAYCKMVKTTYAEEQLLAIRRQMEATASQMTDTQLALCEVYEMMLGSGTAGEGVNNNG